MECCVNEIESGNDTSVAKKTIHVRLKNLSLEAEKTDNTDFFVAKENLQEFAETIGFLRNYLYKLLNENRDPEQTSN